MPFYRVLALALPLCLFTKPALAVTASPAHSVSAIGPDGNSAYLKLAGLLETAQPGPGFKDSLDTAAGFILERDGEAGYAALLRLLPDDSAADYANQLLILKLLSARLDKAYGDFCARSGTVSMPDSAGAPDAMASQVPEKLRAAWAYKRRLLRQPVEGEDLLGSELPEPVKWTYAELYGHILAFLKTGNPASLDPIWDFGWEGWCGTGSEALYEPQRMARLIVLLERGDFPRALRGTRDAEKERQILVCRGLDWERYFLGRMIDYEPEYGDGAMRVLARYGSPETARILAGLAPDAGYGGHWLEGLTEAMGAFLLGPGSRLQIWDAGPPHDYVRDAGAAPLPPDVQRLILNRLTRMVDEEPYTSDALLLVRILSRYEFPAQGVYLNRLAAIPDHRARPEAIQALKKMGLHPGKLHDLAPVVFLIASNGKPFPNGILNVGPTCPQSDPCVRRGESSSIDGGRYGLSRRNYLYYLGKTGSIHLSNYYAGSDPFNDPIFGVDVRAPAAPQEPLRVDIPLRKVEIRLEPPPGYVPEPGARMQVLVQRLEPEAVDRCYPFTKDFRASLAFTSLGDGFYEFVVGAPGLRTWRSGRVEVRGDRIDSAILEKGVDVGYRLRSHQEKEKGFALKVALRNETLGGIVPDPIRAGGSQPAPAVGRAETWYGLAPGKYIMKIDSEMEADPATRKPPKTASRIRRFTITEKTPARLEIGDIWLD
jgi:hypothetical protein